MGVLTSRLFTEGDPVTVQKLEDCATGRPNEFRSHFSKTENSHGEHVRRVQQALKHAQDIDSRLKSELPPFEVNGVYDANFAKAVAKYKEIRNITNYANKIDDIVGIKTLNSLDAENRRHPRDDPPPRPHHEKPIPRPPPNPSNCMTDAEIPTNTVFHINLILGASGGEIGEVGSFTFLMIDMENGLSCAYELSSVGAATPGLPITPSGAGKQSRFVTPRATKITRFGPIGGLTSGTVGPPGLPWSPDNKTIFSILSFGWREGLGIMPSGIITISPFDTGPISLEGAGIQGGRFKCNGICRGGLGATKI